MAFMGMVIAGVFLAIVVIIAILMVIFLIIAIIFKIVGKKKDIKGLKIAGNICLILGILNAIPIVLLTGSIIYSSMFTNIELPDGEIATVLSSKIDRMCELEEANTPEEIAELDELLNDNPALVHYLDINHEGIIDKGLEKGNYEVVETALKNGAIFDDPYRYDHMAYVVNSMDEYLGDIIGRPLTEGDVKIIEAMFEDDVAMNFKKNHPELVYSNMFGKAIWAVLYNDESVTDTEIKFIQVFIDNGVSLDENLLLYEEKPSNVYYSSDYHDDVLRDENYDKIMTIIGK